VVADALSRCDPEAESSLAALSAPEFSLFEEIRKELDSSSEALRGCEQWGSWGKWKVVDGLITVAGKVYVPSSSRSLLAILSWAHDFDHEGAEKHYIDSGEIFMCQVPTSSLKLMFVPMSFASEIKLNTCTPLVSHPVLRSKPDAHCMYA
jgi:hypothetical protein